MKKKVLKIITLSMIFCIIGIFFKNVYGFSNKSNIVRIVVVWILTFILFSPIIYFGIILCADDIVKKHIKRKMVK